jgi:hypothetical protein
MKPFDFNSALLAELEIKTLRAERLHLYNELIKMDSKQAVKWQRITARIKMLNEKLFKLTGNSIYR